MKSPDFAGLAECGELDKELRKMELEKSEAEERTERYRNSFAEELVNAQQPFFAEGEVVVKVESRKDKRKRFWTKLKTVLGWN